eukprot:TRINITY_DN61887_c0_g1_i1.p2 TRINITY_DN61887_c0_g1~~TRINITY_DN61887_c0_g1_i1.p2  ORF type:complete len:192 (-),score=24.64 TRINITY_DN61887_c0_g1_i1:79-654(-)
MKKYSQEQLAELVAQDARQLTEKAKEFGVGAYLLKPVQRERLNERFIQNTLKNVEFANRQLDESVMAGCREKQLSLDRPKSSKQHRTNIYNPSKKRKRSDDEQMDAQDVDDMDEEDVLSFLSKRQVRGRGGVGSRASEPGPFVHEVENKELIKEDRKFIRQLGPLLQSDDTIRKSKKDKKKHKKKKKRQKD